MSVTVVGLGYVGLSISILLSRKFQVHAVDIDAHKVEMLRNWVSPIVDPEITQLLSTQELNLFPTTDLVQSVKVSKYMVVATPTDYDTHKHQFDVGSVREVVTKALEVNPDVNIVIKSTIPVGFVDDLRKDLGSDNIYFSPEFLREGRALHDNLYPSRIIIGGEDDSCREFTSMLATCAESDDCPILFMGTREAEAVKLFANTYLAMRVAYFNELDSFCLSSGLETSDVIHGVCLEPRIGEGYNNPSFGYGGYCFPKDTKQMLANFGEVPQSLISAIVSSNEARADFLSNQILKTSAECVGVHRLSMKTGSDNYRQSAIFGLVKRLVEHGVEIIFYEPNCQDDELFGMRKVDDLELLKIKSDIIIANRFSDELEDVRDKVFSRDVFNVD
jgi:UDPglucose 6-dehydrogenase